MSIMIFGADGYLGWPLTMKLARTFPNEKIILVDNQTRRRLVKEVGGQSITPTLELQERIRALKSVFKLDTNIEWINLDVTSPEVDDVVREHKPRLVYNLAQIGSAPFSMQGPDEAAYLLNNNEVGNLRILFAVRHHCPDAHIIKSGSFGQYAKCGIDIAEGYFFPEYRGKTATIPAPYPRQSDDIYHITKINDSNFVSMAARKWGLRCTDVMQSTVFGVHTEETRTSDLLHTRYDHDEYFGTVLNRFVAQVVTGHPITIYGTGLQRTGLMALEDAIASLVSMASEPALPGQHRVINNVTEKSYCINEIAAELKKIARSKGLNAHISHGVHNPREENELEKLNYNIDTHYLSTKISPSNLENVITEAIATITKYRDQIDESLLVPKFNW